MQKEEEKIVYIIGAGASKGDGIPILKHMKCALKQVRDDIQDLIDNPSNNFEMPDNNKEIILNLFKKLKGVYDFWENNFPDKNIEEVMSEDKNNLLNDFKYSYVAVIMYYAYYYDFYKNSKKESTHSKTYIKFI